MSDMTGHRLEAVISKLLWRQAKATALTWLEFLLSFPLKSGEASGGGPVDHSDTG